MADDPKGEEAQEPKEGQEQQPEPQPKPEPQPEPQVQPQSLSEDQVSSLKESISKDVSGNVIKEVSEKVRASIAEALGLSKKEEEELPKNAEALKRIVDDAVNARMDELGKKAEEDEKQQEQDHQKRIDAIVKDWNSDYARLAEAGKVPKIANATDKADAGIVARRKIILHIGKMIQTLKAQGIDKTPSIADALIDNPNVLKEPAGGDLPVSGNTASRENEDSFKYQEDIAGKTFEQIAQGE